MIAPRIDTTAAPGSVHERNRDRPYWPALDGWRGLTIWIAISVHAGYFTAGGVLSLDTFFVLSGFLITGILLREWLRSDAAEGSGRGTIDLLAFWARRARRLLPALFVVLAAVLFYAAFLAPSLGLDRLRGDTLASLFYVANWRFVLSGQSYFSAFTTPSPLLHLWSLAVEEQFYLFWPPIVLGVLWLARRRLRAAGAVAAVGGVAIVGAIASAVLMASLYVPGSDPSRVYYGTDTRAQAMLVGAALAVIVTLHGPLRGRLGRVALSVASAVGFVVVVLPWFASNTRTVHDFFYGRFGLLAYSVATAAVIWRLAQPEPGLLGRALRTQPLRWVGAISYEMYLWHWPLYLVITPARTGLSGGALLAVRLATVVGFSAVTHFFVGEPIRRGVRMRSPQLARVMTVAALVVVSGGVFVATLGARSALSGDVGQLADASAAPSAASRPSPKGSAGGGSTGGGSADGPIKVLVVGDSQGATLAQGLDAEPGSHGLSAQPGLLVWNRAILGCSISTADTFLIEGAPAQNKCGAAGAWQQQWAADVAEFDPDVVVVQAGAWDLYDVMGADGAPIRPGQPEWKASYGRDIAKLFDTLGAGGATVLAVKPPCYGDSQVVGAGESPPERLDALRIAAVDSVWSRAARVSGGQMLDLNPVLCPGSRSDPAVRPDGAHYGDDGANQVAVMVATAVRELAAPRAASARDGSPIAPTRPAVELTQVAPPANVTDPAFTWYTHPAPDGASVLLGVVRSATPEPHPAILVAPASAGLTLDYLTYAQRFAQRGFDVAVGCWFAPTITPELRATAIDCPQAPVFKGVIDATVADLDALVDAAHEAFGPERELAVIGASRGASIAALRASAGRPEPVVLVSGGFEGWNAFGTTLPGEVNVVERVAAGSTPSGFAASALILHGTADGAIPVEQARHLEAALRAERADVVARYYEGAGHNLDGLPEVSPDMTNRIVRFLCGRFTCQPSKPQ